MIQFDIRQLVVVTSFDPLEIWIYDPFYVRLCAEDYNDQEKNDKLFMALANNSISKYSETPKLYEENMMSQEEFQKFLQKSTGKDFLPLLKERIGSIVKTTLKSTKGSVSARDGSFMVLGFDFMIDSDYQVYLLEVNTSPSNELSTPITSRIIPQFQIDQAALFLDRGAIWGAAKRSNDDSAVGGFTLLFRDTAKKLSLRDRMMGQGTGPKTVKPASKAGSPVLVEAPKGMPSNTSPSKQESIDNDEI